MQARPIPRQGHYWGEAIVEAKNHPTVQEQHEAVTRTHMVARLRDRGLQVAGKGLSLTWKSSLDTTTL